MEAGSPDGASERRGDARALSALVLLVAVFFSPVLFGGRIFYERDIHSVWWSQTEAFVRCVASGSLPLWDPLIGFGQPMLANPNAQIAYPPTWLNLIVPLGLAYTLFAVGHILFAGVGIYFLARHLGASRPASLLASAVLVLSGPVLSMVSLWHHLAGACWMPWVLLAADRGLTTPTIRRGLAVAAASAMQILAGSADMVAMTALIIGARILTVGTPRALWGALSRPRLVVAGVAAIFALGLSAVQWWPAVDYARESARRSLPYEERVQWSLHPVAAAQTFLPVPPRPKILTEAAEKRLFDRGEPFINSVYLGLATVPLAALAIVGPRRSLAWFVCAVVVTAFLVALGRYTYVYDLFALLPPVRMLRYPVKAFAVVALGWALLVGLGWDSWREHRGRLPPVAAILGLAGGALALGAAWLTFRADAWTASWLERPAPTSPLAGALGPVAVRLVVAGGLALLAAVLALATGVRIAAPVAAAAVAVLVVADLALAHHDLNPMAPASLLDRPPIVSAIQKPEARLYVFDYSARLLGRDFRRPANPFLLPRGTSPLVQAAGLVAYLYPPIGRLFGLSGSYEQDMLSLSPRYLRNLTFFLRANEETPGYGRLVRLAGVDYVVALHDAGLEDLEPVGRFPTPFTEAIRLFRVPDSRPRAYVVSGVRIARGREAYMTLVDPTFDPAAEVLLEGGPAVRADPAFRGESRVRERRYDRLIVEARVDRPAFLVVNDAYDPGWRASIDGRPTELVRANVGFRAVALPAGEHTVEMVYRPPSALVGFTLSAVSALGVLLIAGLARAPSP
jgi:Bacterial membrane protein YfhO